jgi:hypothetical protein
LIKRAEGNKTDLEFLQHGNYLTLQITLPQRIFALQRTDGTDGMGSTNVFNARFGKTEEANLAFTHEITDGACYILHRHGPIDPMLVEQIDVIDAEPE